MATATIKACLAKKSEFGSKNAATVYIVPDEACPDKTSIVILIPGYEEFVSSHSHQNVFRFNACSTTLLADTKAVLDQEKIWGVPIRYLLDSRFTSGFALSRYSSAEQSHHQSFHLRSQDFLPTREVSLSGREP